jgi:hypothetical protein
MFGFGVRHCCESEKHCLGNCSFCLLAAHFIDGFCDYCGRYKNLEKYFQSTKGTSSFGKRKYLRHGEQELSSRAETNSNRETFCKSCCAFVVECGDVYFPTNAGSFLSDDQCVVQSVYKNITAGQSEYISGVLFSFVLFDHAIAVFVFHTQVSQVPLRVAQLFQGIPALAGSEIESSILLQWTTSNLKKNLVWYNKGSSGNLRYT